MNLQYKSFMGQFVAAKKEVQQLREVMKESAQLATLTYPTPRAAAAITTQTPKKKS
ncbi:hypothetical protein [Paucibacter sp. XJ19-41]|uniref:hypothetical protein n=1 Tax=Paucibacter sp. XJ19-41 TaxID=2927824 RepID=UPI00234A4A19|nr:hypothetical protein [Paucibacter sp. XJ19-41]MDC6167643.1 hypothetical protein [Paucibacter sp. XJ19-41]